MPILASISAATVSAADLVGEQGEGRTVPIRMLQPILYFYKHRFGYDAWVAVFDEIAGQFAVMDPPLMGNMVGDVKLFLPG